MTGASGAAIGSSPLTRGKHSDGKPGADEAGSSPLTRGKRGGVEVHAFFLRLIPAHAGKTLASALGVSVIEAHPRSRGENEIARAEDVNANGSSPLTRGKPWGGAAVTIDTGLIPAHAGKTARRT